MPWITVPEATALVGRSRTQIYNWAARGLVRTRRNADNILVIDAEHLIEVEPTIIRGRRPGTARPSALHSVSDLN
jgi:alpha-D-ribose 1-methylphosphonate 5-triphosphate diphosphatase PhnM